jgi:hypothetical protein
MDIIGHRDNGANCHARSLWALASVGVWGEYRATHHAVDLRQARGVGSTWDPVVLLPAPSRAVEEDGSWAGQAVEDVDLPVTDLRRHISCLVTDRVRDLLGHTGDRVGDDGDTVRRAPRTSVDSHSCGYGSGA